MEHSKLRVFSIKCNKCSTAWSVDNGDFEKYNITCQNQECKNQFTVYEGLKNGLKSYENFIPIPFLANDMFNGTVDVKIGYTTYFDLPTNITKIYNVVIIPTGAFLAGAVDITKNGFKIFTSLPEDGDVNLIGEDAKVFLMINAKTDDYNIPWIDTLRYAFEALINQEYLTSMLFSEISFEIYVDTVLAEGYRKYGLDEDSISRFLTVSEIPSKVNPLMWNLYKIKLSKSESWNNWERKVLKWRNEVAHGSKNNATKEEAITAYEVVVDSIFYFMEGIDDYIKKENDNTKK